MRKGNEMAAATAANVELTARVTSVIATVEVRVNGEVVGTEEVEVVSAVRHQSYSGQVVKTTYQGLRDLDLDELRAAAERQVLGKYTGRP